MLDVGTVRLSWRRLLNLVMRLPRDSHLVRAIAGAKADWGATEHLLASVFDALNVANWQRGSTKGQAKPAPLRRPGDQPTGLSQDEVQRRLHDLAERERQRKRRRG